MRILIADDHVLVRQSLRYILEELGQGLELIEAGTLDEALERLGEGEAPELVLLDLYMPGMNGLEGLDRLRQALPDTPIVLLTASESRRDIVRAMERGARGFVPKSSSAEVMLGALRLVLSGGNYVPSQILGEVPGARAGGSRRGTPPLKADDEALATLTRRQRDVLALIAEGRTNREIGEELGVNETTVKAHVKAILKALNVANRTQAALIVARRPAGRAA